MNLVAVIVWATDPEPLMGRSLILHECDLCLPRDLPLLCKSFAGCRSSPRISLSQSHLPDPRGCWLSVELLKSQSLILVGLFLTAPRFSEPILPGRRMLLRFEAADLNHRR
jgi:hypothetical protein